MSRMLGDSINYVSAVLGGWYANDQERQAAEKILQERNKNTVEPRFNPERLLKIANLLHVHPSLIEKKFHDFPAGSEMEFSQSPEYDEKMEKRLINEYNNTFDDRKILLQFYANIHKSLNPDVVGKQIL